MNDGIYGFSGETKFMERNLKYGIRFGNFWVVVGELDLES